MYSRSYYQDEERITPPENYDGTSLIKEEIANEELESVSGVGNFGMSLSTHEERGEKGKARSSDGILAGLTNLPFLSGILGRGESTLKMPKIGSEEILILFAAAFLFFSKNGDKETALILLILLLIN